MTKSQLFRISGLVLLVGAAAFTVYIVVRSVITAGPDPASLYKEGLWVLINALGVMGSVLVLLGLPGMYARMASRIGSLGLFGVALIALAWMFLGVFLSLFGMLVSPWLADQAPSLVAASAPLPAGFILAFVSALVIELAGCVLLAIPFIRGHVQPRWVGYVLPASALLTVAGDIVASSGPEANVAMNLLTNMGPVLLLVALGGLGSQEWAEDVPSEQVGPREHNPSAG
jgi:hypothetical protein